MIKIDELRVKNLVLNNGVECAIEIINNELDEVYLLGEDFYYSNFCCNIEPIPLTEEWLIKFGFELYEFYHKENQYRLEDRLIVIRQGFFYDYGTSVKLYSVHQLQNLYFALTNTELNYE